MVFHPFRICNDKEILFVKRMVLLELVLWIRSVYDRISSLKLGLDSALKFQNVKQKKIW